MRQALEDLIEAVEMAINAGDWKVDGACDPTLVLMRAKEALAQPEKWGASAVTHPEYIAEQKAKTQELRSMLAQPEQKPVAKFHVEHRTNACSEVCDAQRKVYATCAWHKDAGQRAELICSLLNTPPPQHKEPEQEILVAVFQAITNAGLTLLKTQHGYELRKLGPAIAHGIKE